MNPMHWFSVFLTSFQGSHTQVPHPKSNLEAKHIGLLIFTQAADNTKFNVCWFQFLTNITWLLIRILRAIWISPGVNTDFHPV